MERFAEQQPVIEKYPPHNILKQEDNKYVVELATAGFKQDELSIEVKEEKLSNLSGKAKTDIIDNSPLSGEVHSPQDEFNNLTGSIKKEEVVTPAAKEKKVTKQHAAA